MKTMRACLVAAFLCLLACSGSKEAQLDVAKEIELCKDLDNITTEPGDLPQLSILIEGKETALPLKHTAVKAELSNFIARVEVKQRYQNTYTTPIEVSYLFPLPENSAVYAMEIKIGDRLIGAEIKKREEARAIYEQARRAGYTAALLEQQRPNVFQQSIANIEPGKEIEVTIRYAQTLSFDAGLYEFVFPMVVGERFTPDGQASDVNPTIYGRGQRPGDDISIEVKVDKTAVNALEVPTHEVNMNTASGGTTITLSPKDSFPNRDFVLRYAVGSKETSASLLTHRANGEGFFSLVVQPPRLDLKELIGDREIIFVVDVSGSMSGEPIALCQDAIQQALAGLRPVDTFNIITFAGATNQLFTRAMPANNTNIAIAKSFVLGLAASGGTHIDNAITQALSTDPSNERNRYVFFLTDGLVNNEDQIISLTERYVKEREAQGRRARVFGFGVSNEPNRHLLDSISTVGKGLTVYASNKEDPLRAVNQFYRYIDHSIMEDLKIDWSGLPVEDVQPKILPDLFASHPIIITGKYKSAASGTIRLQGKINDKEVSIPLEVVLPEENLSNLILGTVWARTKIESLTRELRGGYNEQLKEEITTLALKHHIVTRYTSLVAVDSSKKIEPETMTADGKGKKHAGDEGRMGAKSPSGLYQMKGPGDSMDPLSARDKAEEIALNGGVGNIKGSGAQGSPFASVFGGDDAVSTSPEDLLGGLLGDRPGEAEGSFGLGLRGTGGGNGGIGQGTLGLGNDNTIGRGGAGFGGRATSGAEVTEGKAEIKGSLDKDIIRRVIRRAMPGIKFCYEQALAQNPALTGKIKIAFVIAANGAVTSSSATSGIQADVDACVARKIAQLSFPAPQGGGTVDVIYPFTFKPN